MESGLPLVSVVTLTYRHFDNLYKTIKSVLEQDYPSIQYIICDDGSDNFPRNEIEKFISEKSTSIEIVIEHNQKNQGTVKNINHANKLATGKLRDPGDFSSNPSSICSYSSSRFRPGM